MEIPLYEKDALKPCPLCGMSVRITEFDVCREGEATNWFAKIECGCGLTFERHWMTSRGYKLDADIVKLWNERKEKNNAKQNS